MVIKIEVDPGDEFNRAVKKTIKEVEDLTIPFTLISKSWFQSNKAIFRLKSPGKYADLSRNYKNAKKAMVGFVYPILKLHGKLEKSITDPTASGAISLILNKQTLVLGTAVPYAQFHQKGTRFMPARPAVLVGAEQTAPPELNKRQEIWIETLANYVLERSKQVGRTKR